MGRAVNKSVFPLLDHDYKLGGCSRFWALCAMFVDVKEQWVEVRWQDT